MQFVDTHAHIQFNNYKLNPAEVMQDARNDGVTTVIIVGCDLESSVNAVTFSRKYEGAYPAVGIHPHEAKNFLETSGAKQQFETLLKENQDIVAIGEFGLDYFYENSPKDKQIELFKYQLGLATKYDLPLLFHVRDAFSDFWPIFDEFSKGYKFRGVVHCFTATQKELDQALERGLFVALNGIMTFTKDQKQLEAAKNVPLNKLLLETDAPFLTPVPFRGNICQPKHVVQTAEFLSGLRGESIDKIASQTTENAKKLFNIR